MKSQELAFWITKDNDLIGCCYYDAYFSELTMFGFEKLYDLINNYNERLSTMDTSSEMFIYTFFSKSDTERKNAKSLAALFKESAIYMKEKYKNDCPFCYTTDAQHGMIAIAQEDIQNVQTNLCPRYNVYIDFDKKTINFKIFKIGFVSEYKEDNYEKINFNPDCVQFNELYDLCNLLNDIDKPFFTQKFKDMLYEKIEQE